jgi:hypothetical protein
MIDVHRSLLPFWHGWCSGCRTAPDNHSCLMGNQTQNFRSGTEFEWHLLHGSHCYCFSSVRFSWSIWRVSTVACRTIKSLDDSAVCPRVRAQVDRCSDITASSVPDEASVIYKDHGQRSFRKPVGMSSNSFLHREDTSSDA